MLNKNRIGILIPLVMLLFLLSKTDSLKAQNNSSHDSLIKQLPFVISKEKKLPEEELADKKEGMYLTAIPDISSDPVNGFGYGAEGSLFFNGKRSDPFFNYTAYRAKIDIALFNTTRNQREIRFRWDVPYIFNSKWRLRGEIGYEINPNLLYFGINEQSLNPLSYYPSGDSSKIPVNNARYSDYKNNALTGVNQFYNTYTKKEAVLNISMERSFIEGKLKTLIGYEIANVRNTSFSGNSLLQNDFNKGLIKGVGNNVVSFAQIGLIYDTRDLETDPSKGVFAELTNEVSLKALGSQYNFNKTFTHFNYYHSLFPSVFKKLIFAGRVGIGYTAGDAPFYEYYDEWSVEGSIEGLGGTNTIRGYKSGRFLSRVMQFSNFELRCRLVQFNKYKQHFAISAVPFFDAGGVWDSLDRITTHLNNMRYSEGLGIRIAWNVNTILRFDYAISNEDNQFFFQIGHTF